MTNKLRSREPFLKDLLNQRILEQRRFLLVAFLLLWMKMNSRASSPSIYGKVTDCEIIRDHVSKRSRGFRFIEFDEEQVVDNLLSKMSDALDVTVFEIVLRSRRQNQRNHHAQHLVLHMAVSLGDVHTIIYSYDGGFGDSYNNFGSGGGFGSASYRSSGGMSGRFGDYGYGGGRYGDFGAGEFGNSGGSGRYHPYVR
uniref:Heterogeneous nuclear ribonucleoprotein A1 n=2 Tax=Solanum tuberosum TaxID=4113 RepID=M1CT90_SOLTU